MSHTFTAYIEVPVQVTFDFTPAEPTTWKDPGSPEEIEILDTSIKLSKEDIQTLEIQASDHMVDLHEAAEESRAESMWEDRMMMGCPA